MPDVRAVPVYIYALTEPDGTVRYVGRSQNPKARYRAHHSFSSGLVWEWLQSLVANGQRAGLSILHVVAPGEDATPHEARLIRQHEATCLNLMGLPNWWSRDVREEVRAAAKRMLAAKQAQREARRARREKHVPA